jgi:hypothetical protein
MNEGGVTIHERPKKGLGKTLKSTHEGEGNSSNSTQIMSFRQPLDRKAGRKENLNPSQSAKETPTISDSAKLNRFSMVNRKMSLQERLAKE